MFVESLVGRVACITALLAVVSPALATCDEEKAVTELQQCRNQIHLIDKKIFNASRADHVNQACCSAMGHFEECIRTAVRLAGCHHEVDYLLTLMMTKARELLGHMYDANCWYGCGTAAASAPFALTALIALALTVPFWRT